MIKKHNCTNYLGNPNGANYQNETHGEGNRIVSVNNKGDFVCSVCGEVIKNDKALIAKKTGGKK